jgi:putative aminopeptidase FrvX
VIRDEEIQDCIILLFGKPRTAVFAHMDSVGYTVGYENELIKIGGPKAEEGTLLVGEDSGGSIEGKLHYEIEEEDDDSRVITTKIVFEREIDRGTSLTYKIDFKADDKKITTAYIDNRLGILNALKLCESLENGAICFSAWEEVGGGSVGYLAAYLYNNCQVSQALISDISWITKGVLAEKGPVISIRDSGIPRRSYVNKIIELAKSSSIPFQLEVESSGGSDGNALQRSPYPFDWCFIGAAEENVHMPNETVYLKDIDAMFSLYQYLMKHL